MMLGMHPWTGLSDDVRLGVLTEWVSADLVDEVLLSAAGRDEETRGASCPVHGLLRACSCPVPAGLAARSPCTNRPESPPAASPRRCAELAQLALGQVGKAWVGCCRMSLRYQRKLSRSLRR